MSGAIPTVIADDHPIWRTGPDLVDLHVGEGGGMSVVAACASDLPIVILTVSEAERDLLEAVADELFISPRTVDNHVRNIMAKLHLSRRHELVRWAVDRGIT